MVTLQSCHGKTSSRSLCSELVLLFVLGNAAHLAFALHDPGSGSLLQQPSVDAQGPGSDAPGGDFEDDESHLPSAQAADLDVVKERVEVATETLHCVQTLLVSVEALASRVLADAALVVTDLLPSFHDAKALANSMKAPIGTGPVNNIASTLDHLSLKFRESANMMEQASNDVKLRARGISQEFADHVHNLLRAFEVAVKDVDQVRNQTSFQPTGTRSLHNWMGGGSNKFEKARLAISDARSLETQLVTKLGGVNSSAVDLLVSLVTGTVESGFGRLSDAVDEAILNLGDTLPALVRNKIRSLLPTPLSLNLLRSRIEVALKGVNNQATRAKAVAPLMYGATNIMVALVDEAEGKQNIAMESVAQPSTQLQHRILLGFATLVCAFMM